MHNAHPCDDTCWLQGVSLPATQTVPNYALLSLVYGTALLAKRVRPVNAWTSYAAVSLLDVEGNFLVVSHTLPHILPGLRCLDLVCQHTICATLALTGSLNAKECICSRVGMCVQVLAFRYTFLTSIQLLNSFTVPCVFILWAP